MPIVKAPASESSDMESLYSEEGDSTPPEPEAKEEKPDVEEHTELVSNKLVMGKDVKPGDKIILTVVKNYGDQIEVKYGTEHSEPEEPGMSEDEQLNALTE